MNNDTPDNEGFEGNNNSNYLDIRSEEVQEIIGKPPHWLVRSGIGIFILVLFLILFISSFIKYPEVVETTIKLTSINAPKSIESKVSGKIVKLNIDDQEYVSEGDVLAWLESTANHEDVLELSVALDSLYKWITLDEQEKITQAEFKERKLGELQSSFQVFEQSYRNFVLALPGGYKFKQKAILELEKTYLDSLLKGFEAQRIIQNTNYELAKKELEIQKKLSDKNLTSELDVLKAENNLSNQTLPIEQLESSIINNRLSKIGKEKEIMDLEKAIDEQRYIFVESLNTFRSSIYDWKSKYILMAPLDGVLTYAGVIQEQQTISLGDIVFFLNPQNVTFFGEVMISQESYGKLEKGQEVLVSFSGYPYHEFGKVTGKISYISNLPVDGTNFFLKIDFDNGLQTNYGNLIPPQNGMLGEAEIITQDLKLLERIYSNLTKELR